MDVRVREPLLRRMGAAGATILVLGAFGASMSRAASQDQTHDLLGTRHGRATVRQAAIIRVHGPLQVPKVGRIDPKACAR
jgi:hypothetical protein